MSQEQLIMKKTIFREELLTQLELIKNILNEKEYLDIDNLCEQVENCHIDSEDTDESHINRDSVIIKLSDVKKTLFANEQLIPGLESSFKPLFELLFLRINIEDKVSYPEIIKFSVRIANVLKVFEKHIASFPIKNVVADFLICLIQILGNGSTPTDLNKTPIRLLVTKIIGTFIEVEVARKLILSELTKKLRRFHFFILKLRNKRELFETPLLEDFMVNLSVLKEILIYEDQQQELKTQKGLKREENSLRSIKTNLSEVMGKLPSFVQVLAQECLNLLVFVIVP